MITPPLSLRLFLPGLSWPASLFCGLLCGGFCLGSLSGLGRLSLCFEGSLQFCESGEITESGLLYLRQVESGFFSLSGFLSCLGSSLLALLPCAEVRNEDTLSVTVEDFEASGIK